MRRFAALAGALLHASTCVSIVVTSINARKNYANAYLFSRLKYGGHQPAPGGRPLLLPASDHGRLGPSRRTKYCPAQTTRRLLPVREFETTMNPEETRTLSDSPDSNRPKRTIDYDNQVIITLPFKNKR